MAVTFPNSPSDGDQVTFAGVTYTYYATKGVWQSSTASFDGYLQVANLQPQLDNYLQVANSTSFATTSSLDAYLQVANSLTFATTSQLDGYLQVANSTGFASSTDLDAYLQVANSTSFATTSQLDGYLQVANSTGFASSTDLDAYLQVANVSSYGYATTSQLDGYLQVANSTGFASSTDLDAYLQVANSTSFASTSDLDAYLQVANVSSYAFASEKVFTVTNDGSSAYKFYGVGTGADASQANSNPTLYLSRGEKYIFNVNASGHPFYINTTNTTGTGNAFANGVINNGTQVGNVEFTVPMNAPDTLHYNCSIHSSMNGTIYVLSQTSTDTSSFQTKADATAANNALLSLIQDRLQVANLQPQLDKYLQVANGISLTAFDVITTAPSGNGSLIYTSANGSFTFTPANATQGGGGGGGASVTISDAAPSSPSAGDMWFDSEDLILYVYYNDGSSSQWVKSSPSGVPSPVALSETAPQSPNAGDLWFDTSVLKVFIYYNDGDSSQWIEINSLAGNEDTGSATNVNWVERTANTTITAGEKYILNTSSALTITLPASASIGDEIRIIDGTGNAATNNITIGRNGHKIQGSAADMVIDVNRAAFGLVYYNATHGWVLTER